MKLIENEEMPKGEELIKITEMELEPFKMVEIGDKKYIGTGLGAVLEVENFEKIEKQIEKNKWKIITSMIFQVTEELIKKSK